MANNRKNPPAKWVLPTVIDPPRRCFTIQVPDDRQHIAAFRGALYNLTSARFWQDDLAHTALLVAKVWQDIYDEVVVCTEPIPDNQGISLDEDISMQIRLNPDDPCVIQMWCIDHWENWYDPRICGPVGSQPGGGNEATSHPEPGSCETYHAQMRASSQWIAPFVVNEGDVITTSNRAGAGHDPLLTQWQCITGRTYFAGDCVGFSSFSAGDQLSTAYHMQLIMNVDGTWYDALAPLTVPSGVVNSQVIFQMNVPSGGLPGLDGSYTFDVEQCNNATETWEHTFDFSLSNYGWSVDPAYPDAGEYLAGLYWNGTVYAAGVLGGLLITKSFSSRHLTHVKAIYDVNISDSEPAGFYSSGGTLASFSPATGDNQTFESDISATLTDIGFNLNWGANTGSGHYSHVKSITLIGQGTDPFLV